MEGMGRKVRYADVMSTVAVFLALCGGAWAVQSQSSATRTIRACVSKKSGSVRVLAAGRRCARTERTLAWNQRGPAGARGLAGPPGQAGATGVQGPAGSDAQFTGAAAGGSLSGTYPNPALAANAVGTSALAAGAVTGAKIANSTIANANIAPLTITGGSLANATVTGAKVASNTLTGTQIDESTLTGVPAVGSAGNSTQLAANSGLQPLLTVAGSSSAQASCGASGQSATVTYKNESATGQLVTQVSQVQGSAPALTGAEVSAGASTAAATAGATATPDRALRVVYTASPNTDGTSSAATVVVVDVFTSWIGGGTCLARAQAFRMG